MKDAAPSSRSPFPYGQPVKPGQLQAYCDEPALDRVWNRLETRRRRSPGPAPIVRGMAAAALVFGGVFLGIFIERTRSETMIPNLASSEVIVPRLAPAAPVTDSSLQNAGPERQLKKEVVKTKRHHRRLRRRLSAERKDLNEAPAEEIVEEPALVEVEEVEAAPPSKPAWSVLADQGEFAAAFQKLDESGGFDGVLTGGSSEELMALADVARFVGRQGRAIQALRAVTERYQGDPNAPLAAMILGNLLSRAGDPAGAAEAYSLNRRLSPGGDFAEDALVREFDMAVANGDLGAVGRFRSQYEAEFPGGRHLENMRAEEASLVDLSRVEGTLDGKIELGSEESDAPQQPTDGSAKDSKREESD